MKPDTAVPGVQPSLGVGSLGQEERICLVCGTKFYVTADREFCPVCILRGATSGESASTGESGSVSGLAAASAEEADGGLQARRFHALGNANWQCTVPGDFG